MSPLFSVLRYKAFLILTQWVYAQWGISAMGFKRYGVVVQIRLK